MKLSRRPVLSLWHIYKYLWTCFVMLDQLNQVCFFLSGTVSHTGHFPVSANNKHQSARPETYLYLSKFLVSWRRWTKFKKRICNKNVSFIDKNVFWHFVVQSSHLKSVHPEHFILNLVIESQISSSWQYLLMIWLKQHKE